MKLIQAFPEDWPSSGGSSELPAPVLVNEAAEIQPHDRLFDLDPESRRIFHRFPDILPKFESLFFVDI